MSILDQLSQQVPRMGRKSPHSPLRVVTKRYLSDISKAKALGYSWNQICKAVKADMGEEWDESWRSCDIADHYKAILKEEGQ